MLVNLKEKTKVVLVELQRRSESKVKSNAKNSFVKLLKFDLPKFYGKNESWISFNEFFISKILKNEQLSKIEKLPYLHASVCYNADKIDSRILT